MGSKRTSKSHATSRLQKLLTHRLGRGGAHTTAEGHTSEQRVLHRNRSYLPHIVTVTYKLPQGDRGIFLRHANRTAARMAMHEG